LSSASSPSAYPFLLEAGYSARSATDHDELPRELMALLILQSTPWSSGVRSTPSVNSPALGTIAFRPVDLIVAALADRQSVGVLTATATTRPSGMSPLSVILGASPQENPVT
jgi:hypothetical protein